jgi:hypothetical protein
MHIFSSYFFFAANAAADLPSHTLCQRTKDCSRRRSRKNDSCFLQQHGHRILHEGLEGRQPLGTHRAVHHAVVARQGGGEHGSSGPVLVAVGLGGCGGDHRVNDRAQRQGAGLWGQHNRSRGLDAVHTYKHQWGKTCQEEEND